MRKYFTLFAFALSVFLLVTAFDDNNKNNSQVIYERQQQRLADFIDELSRFSRFVPDNETTDEQLQDAFLLVRNRFKQWEYLAEYDDPDFVRLYVNGAPLPKIIPNTANLEVAQPRGMQVLDELVFSGNINEHREEITREVNLLLGELIGYKKFKRPVYDRMVLEAARVELVRIFTLGLTGFDVPASGNSVNDAIAALETIQIDLRLYKELFEKTDANTAALIFQFTDGCIEYLKNNNDFDNLDRLHILKTYVNPLYAALLEIHKGSGIEMLHETVPYALQLPYNPQANNLFSNELLDFTKYLQLPPPFNTAQTVQLGKMLFFDPALSSNNQRSCAGCHHPGKAFTDGKPKSIALGFDGTVDRNAPTLVNCVYNERFFHDMRADALEDQVEHVLVNRKEFDTDMFAIVDKLKDSDEYMQLFESAFNGYPGDKLNAKTISFALSAYISSLRGFNSEFDRYVRGETFRIDPAVQRGFNLFMGKAVCGTCHFAPVFNGTVPPMYRESESEVLGVPENPYVKKPVLDPDRGRMAGRVKEAVYFYEYSFKTPTVRNVALTAPYMHNGAYKTLEDVMDFYNKGGGVGLGIRVEHQTLPFDSLSLNKQEISDIVAFMKALTDTTGMTSVPVRLPLFSNVALNDRKVGGEY
ncbi:MAG TPA: cytochrome c peroxidase [Flavipsychrobacter sp.]